MATKQSTKVHMCYILKSTTTNRSYVGYTVNIERRRRQHNGELTHGARATHHGRPWVVGALITGFKDKRAALRFECAVKHWKRPRGCGYKKRIEQLENYVSVRGPIYGANLSVHIFFRE